MENKAFDRCHALEGNGCLPQLFHYAWNRRYLVLSSQPGLQIPSTVVYADGFPTEWQLISKTGETELRVGKDINTRDVLKDMCTHNGVLVTDDGTCVAWYMFKPNHEDDQKAAVEFFDRRGLDLFLHGKCIRRDGFLQKVVPPDGKHNVVIQCIWSPNPAATIVGKRENLRCFGDRRHTMAERTITYDGPTHFSREAFVAPHIQWQVKTLCQSFVHHILQTEHVQVQRMACYFKVDHNSEVWLLWCSSLRIHSYGIKNPINLVIEYQNVTLSKRIETAEHDSTIDPISLLESSIPDYSREVTNEDDTNIQTTTSKIPITDHTSVSLYSHAAFFKAAMNYNPTPPSIGPLKSVFSRCMGYKVKLTARKKILNRLRQAQNACVAYKADDDDLMHDPVIRRLDSRRASNKRRSTILSEVPNVENKVTPTASINGDLSASQEVKPLENPRDSRRRLKPGQRALILRHDNNEWEILSRPKAKPDGKYFWKLIRIALRVQLLKLESRISILDRWIERNCKATASQKELLIPSEVFSFIGKPLIAHLRTEMASLQELPPVPVSATLRVLGVQQPSHRYKINKHRCAIFFWDSIRHFCKAYVETEFGRVRQEFTKYKEIAREQETVRLKSIDLINNEEAGVLKFSDDRFAFSTYM